MELPSSHDTKAEVSIRNALRPGDIGAVIELHGLLYAREKGFDHTFEPYVAVPLAECVKRAAERERIWIVDCNGRVSGSIAIVEHSRNEAQLRWLLLDPRLRGLGIGRALVKDAIAFARQKAYRSIFLWTVSGLVEAEHLYLSFGFWQTEQKKSRIWGTELTELRMELTL
jgi:GNAT superfamily N-acetyltransferase